MKASSSAREEAKGDQRDQICQQEKNKVNKILSEEGRKEEEEIWSLLSLLEFSLVPVLPSKGVAVEHRCYIVLGKDAECTTTTSSWRKSLAHYDARVVSSSGEGTG